MTPIQREAQIKRTELFLSLLSLTISLESLSPLRALRTFLLQHPAPLSCSLPQGHPLCILRAVDIFKAEMLLPSLNRPLNILPLFDASITSCKRLQINSATLELVIVYAYSLVPLKDLLVPSLKWCQ